MHNPLITALNKLKQGSSEAQRLLHGRGHCFPGFEAVNLDYFPPLLLITLYQPLAPEYLQPAIEQCRELQAVDTLLIQYRYQDHAPTEVLFGECPKKLAIEQAGLNYWIYPGQQQNIGFFLDMAEGRRWVREHSQGRRVLNLFAYTCAFSVTAIAGGAESVVNLDMSRAALERGRDNHRLNQQPLERVRFLPHELFRSWGKVKRLGPYELVIIDPPSFQRGSFVATKDYQRVLRRLPELMAAEGQILLCLNDPNIETDFLLEGMRGHCPQAEFVERLPLPEEFLEQQPERALKTLVFNYRT